MPYEEKYQLAITYEVDPTEYQQERSDVTLFEWLSGVGGLGFLFRFSHLIIKFSDNPDMFVTSAMVAQSNLLRRSTGATVAIQSQDSIRETPCTVFQTKCASSKRVPRWCKRKCGGTKARLFTNLHKNLAHEMQVTYVL